MTMYRLWPRTFGECLVNMVFIAFLPFAVLGAFACIAVAMTQAGYVGAANWWLRNDPDMEQKP